MNYPPPQGWGAPPPPVKPPTDRRAVVALGIALALALVCGVFSVIGKRDQGARLAASQAVAQQQAQAAAQAWVAQQTAAPAPVPAPVLQPDAAEQLERFVHDNACEPGRRRNTERCPPDVLLMGPIRLSMTAAGVEATIETLAARDNEGMALGARLCRRIITDARRPVPVAVLFVVGIGGQRLAFGRAPPGQAGPCFRADTPIWQTL